MDDLPISIGNLGNYELLAKCLDSIFAEDSPELRFTVWVVYNAPDEIETYETIAHHAVTSRAMKPKDRMTTRRLKAMKPAYASLRCLTPWSSRCV